MEVSCEITLDDHMQFNEYHCAHSPTVRNSYLVSLFVGPVICLLMGLVLSLAKGDWSGLVIFGAGGVAYLFIFPRHWKKLLRKRTIKLLSEGPHGMQPYRQTVRIDDGGLFVSSPKASSTVRWSAIEKIEESATAVYLYINSVNAFVIPKRAFDSEASYLDFLSEVRRLREVELGLAGPERMSIGD